MVISTHYMFEADYLGYECCNTFISSRLNILVFFFSVMAHWTRYAHADRDRIAIMSEGRLACAGTGLFLKSALGKGYILSLSRDINNNSDDNAPIHGISSVKSALSSILIVAFH